MQSVIEELAVQEWEDPENYTPSFNIAPTQISPILLDDGRRRVQTMRWGLVPAWAKDTKFAARMINARAETIQEKPAFRSLLPNRRCVVITDGYYEWRRSGDDKQPFYIHHPDNRVLPMAGLWDRWVDPAGQPLLSYTVITIAPQPDLAFIHNRMPVILEQEAIDRWLQTRNFDPRSVLPLLRPYKKKLDYYPVSERVNSVYNNGIDLIQPRQ